MASIQKRGENSWLLVVESGYKADGSRAKKTRTVRIEDPKLLRTTKRLQDHLNDELSKFKAEVEAGEYIAPEKMTLAAFVEEWREKYAKQELAPLTHKTYEHHLKNHILPALGHMRISDIKPLHIQTLMHSLSQPGARRDGHGEVLSAGTREYIYRVMKNVFTRAKGWQVISKHPMEGISKPRSTQGEMQFFDEDEAGAVIEALFTEPVMWRLFCIGAMLGGFRRGELIGLEWPDIDEERNTISVNKSISLTLGGEAYVKAPKSKGSKRIVPMPDWYMQELREYRLECKKNRMRIGDKWEGNGREYVFQIGFGKPIYHTTPSKWWSDFLQRHGLKQIRFHDLRHSAASILIQNDVSMKAIQERLGHSRHQTTADLYAHVAQSVSRAAADKLEKLNPRKRISSTTRQQG